MGIDGLHNLIKPCLQKLTLYQLKGQRAAIDGAAFLYKGCYSCAYQLNNKIPTKDYMLLLIRIIRMIKTNGIQVIVVFDGRDLKAKEITIKKRNEAKKKNLEEANKLVSEEIIPEKGRHGDAFHYYRRCLKVSTSMIYETIDVLKAYDFDYIMAPYEADSQIAYMVRQQEVDFAITEDADLISFGCPKIAFKLQMDATFQYFDISQFETVEQRKELKSEPLRCFLSLSEENRTLACIMAGCDYLPSIYGIGIKTSSYLFYNCKDFKSVMEKLRSEKKTKNLIPESYDLFVEKVALIFQHQRVFDIKTDQLVTLNPLPRLFSSEDQKLIGEIIPNFKEVATGKVEKKNLTVREIQKIDLKTFFVTNKQAQKPFFWANKQHVDDDKKKDKKAQKEEDQRIAMAAAAIRNLRKENGQPTKTSEKKEVNRKDENGETEELKSPQIEYDPDLNEDYLLSLLEQYQDPRLSENEDNDLDVKIEEISAQKRSPTIGEQKIMEKEATYLEYLCDTFARQYKSMADEGVVESVTVKPVVSRSLFIQKNEPNLKKETSEIEFVPSMVNSEQEQQLQQQSVVVNTILKKNPFAVSKKDQSKIEQMVSQPDSFEILNPEMIKQQTPSKKKATIKESDILSQKTTILTPIKEGSAKKPLNQLTDFFSYKKIPKTINLNLE